METNDGLKTLLLILSRELSEVQSAVELSGVLCFTGMGVNSAFGFNF